VPLPLLLIFQTIWKLVVQTIKIKKAIKQENNWLINYCNNHKVDLIISDNRYGSYHPNIYSIIVTHQLSPIAPFPFFFNNFFHTQIARYINKFNECWIYDNQLPNNIAGKLSISDKILIPKKYIGCHTRLQQLELPKKYDAVIILSGPHPQLQIFFEIIWNQAFAYSGKLAIVAGNNNLHNIDVPKNIDFYAYANDNIISTLVAQSNFVICRSGYTSVMDYLILQAKCIFIPTPGQSEQAYLASHLQSKNYAITFNQNNFTIINAIEKAKSFEYTFLKKNKHNLEDIIFASTNSYNEQ
jgi:UDP-N-acetylglucosamine transferase subunit ALG13